MTLKRSHNHSTPFVVGVLADLTGVPVQPLPRLRDRRFVTVTKESIARLFLIVRPSAGIPGADNAPPLRFESLDGLAAHDDPRLAGLQATSAGLEFLAKSMAAIPGAKVKVLDVSKKDLLRDLQRAPEFSQSALFKKVYREEAGTFGGEAFSCIVLDRLLTGHPNECELARKLAQVAAAAGAPLLCCGDAEFHRLLSERPENQRNDELDESWSREDSCFFFSIGPRFRVVDAKPSVWISAAFLAAALIPRITEDEDGTRMLPLSESIQFEEDPPGSRYNRFGANRIGLPMWPSITVSAPGRHAPCSLAHALSMGSIAHRLRHHLRCQRHTDSLSALHEEAAEWVFANCRFGRAHGLRLFVDTGPWPGHGLVVRFLLPSDNSLDSSLPGVMMEIADGLWAP